MGPLRLCREVKLKSIHDESLLPAAIYPPAYHVATEVRSAAAIETALHSAVGPSINPFLGSNTLFDEFIQELPSPTSWARVTGEARFAVVYGLSAGKVVAVSASSYSSISAELIAPEIDTIAIYVVSPLTLTICIEDPTARRTDEARWADAPYIVRGLTLPIHEADPSLGTLVQEHAAAVSRLVGGETISWSEFHRMADSLRPATAAATLGRSGERITLVRSDTTQAFEEMTFESQLSLLVAHPRLRRVLGFGFVDKHGLIKGRSYEYRITGRFAGDDLYDDIYDFHLGPAGTPLPSFFTVRGLAVRSQMPSLIVFDPAPASDSLGTVARRGMLVDATGFDLSWLTPGLEGSSLVLDLPRAVTDLEVEVSSSNTLQYTAGPTWIDSSASALQGPRFVL